MRASLAAKLDKPPGSGVPAPCGYIAFQVRTASVKWDVHLADPDPETDWQPVRELRSAGYAVRLEDTDPFRDCHQWPATPRLNEEIAARWQQQFAVAMAFSFGVKAPLNFSVFVDAAAALLLAAWPRKPVTRHEKPYSPEANRPGGGL